MGESAVYPFPYRILQKSDLKCYLAEGNNERQLTESEFSVEDKEDYSSGANVTLLLNPLPAGAALVILREVPYTQDCDLPNAGKLPSESLEVQLDRTTMQIQQLKEEVDRAISVPPTSLMSPTEYLQVNIKVAEQAKDICLNSAVSAANSAQTAAVCERNMSLIWGELTGDPELANNALLTVKEAAEATGAVTTALEVAKGEIINTGSVALAAVQKATEEAKEAADVATNTAGSITGTVADQITIQVSQAVGADGVLGAAIAEAEKVIGDAKAELEKAQADGLGTLTDAQKAALAQIQGKIDGITLDIQAALDRADITAQTYLQNAKDTTDKAIADLTEIRDKALADGDTVLAEIAQKRLEAMQEIGASLSDAQAARDAAMNAQTGALGSASAAGNKAQEAAQAAAEAAASALGASTAFADALAKAQEAAKAAADAEAARLAAEGIAGDTATNIVNQSLVLHNASADAHPGKFVKRIGDSDITGNLTLTGEGKGGLFAAAVTVSWQVQAPFIKSLDGFIESCTSGSSEPFYRWFNSRVATDIRMADDGTLFTWNVFGSGTAPFKAAAIEVNSDSLSGAFLRIQANGLAWTELYLNEASHLCVRTPGSATPNGIISAAEVYLEGAGYLGSELNTLKASRTNYPNYAAGIDLKAVVKEADYTVPQDGWLYVHARMNAKLYVNGGLCGQGNDGDDCVFIPVKAGDIVTKLNVLSAIFYPDR